MLIKVVHVHYHETGPLNLLCCMERTEVMLHKTKLVCQTFYAKKVHRRSIFVDNLQYLKEKIRAPFVNQ